MQREKRHGRDMRTLKLSLAGALGSSSHILLAKANHMDKPGVSEVGKYTPPMGDTAHGNDQGAILPQWRKEEVVGPDCMLYHNH